MAKTQKMNIEIELLLANVKNVRLTTDGNDLVTGISSRGLDKALVVSKREDGTYVILQGHRRKKALDIIKATNGKAWEAFFKKGVPCEVYEGLTEEQELDILADHGDTKTLVNPFEFYLLAKAKWAFHTKYTEKEILSFIGSALPMSGKGLTEVQELNVKIEQAIEPIEKAKYSLEREARLFTYHKGRLQTWNGVRRCPQIVEDLLKWTYTGVVPAVPEEYRCRITQKEADALYACWLDCVINANANNEKVNREMVLEELPDMFTEKLRELAKAQNSEGDKDDTPYAKIAKAVKASGYLITVNGTETDIWQICQELFAASEAAKAAEKAAKKASK